MHKSVSVVLICEKFDQNFVSMITSIASQPECVEIIVGCKDGDIHQNLLAFKKKINTLSIRLALIHDNSAPKAFNALQHKRFNNYLLPFL